MEEVRRLVKEWARDKGMVWVKDKEWVREWVKEWVRDRGMEWVKERVRDKGMEWVKADCRKEEEAREEKGKDKDG
jgi:hypothetical protein